MNTCEFLKIPCVHPECAVLVKKSDLTLHLERECTYRLEKCTFCQRQIVFSRMRVGYADHQNNTILLLRPKCHSIASPYERLTGPFNPLTPMSDQDRISPYFIYIISCRKMTRIKKNINYGITN